MIASKGKLTNLQLNQVYVDAKALNTIYFVTTLVENLHSQQRQKI